MKLLILTTLRYDLPHKPTLIRAVTTSLNAVNDDPDAYSVPWWLYLLAILIGLVILALLILLLWRVSLGYRSELKIAKFSVASSNVTDLIPSKQH